LRQYRSSRDLPWTNKNALVVSRAVILGKPLGIRIATPEGVPLLLYLAQGITAHLLSIQDRSIYVFAVCLDAYRLPLGRS
jgi:hypothetical protein